MLASRLLKRWLKRKGPGAAFKLAKSLKVAPSTVHYYAKGAMRPRADRRRMLALLTSGGVPELAWLTRAERTALKKLEAA